MFFGTALLVIAHFHNDDVFRRGKIGFKALACFYAADPVEPAVIKRRAVADDDIYLKTRSRMNDVELFLVSNGLADSILADIELTCGKGRK